MGKARWQVQEQSRPTGLAQGERVGADRRLGAAWAGERLRLIWFPGKEEQSVRTNPLYLYPYL